MNNEAHGIKVGSANAGPAGGGPRQGGASGQVVSIQGGGKDEGKSGCCSIM